MMLYIWLGVIVCAVVVEALTLSLVSVWFVPGAFVAMILSCIPGIPLWVQIAVCLAISLLLFIFLKPLLKKFIVKNRVATNADALIGEEAVVTEKISNLEGVGQVKVRGQIWTARAESKDVVYEPGEVLHVLSIQGVKLICKK